MKKPRKTAAKAKKTPVRPPRASGTVTLAAECTLNNADALLSQLSRTLTRATAVTIDVGAVKKIDAASLQLLAAFVHTRRTNGRPVAWRGEAPALTLSARRLGLGALLEPPATTKPRA